MGDTTNHDIHGYGHMYVLSLHDVLPVYTVITNQLHAFHVFVSVSDQGICMPDNPFQGTYIYHVGATDDDIQHHGYMYILSRHVFLAVFLLITN